jgi:hypothetical protein
VPVHWLIQSAPRATAHPRPPPVRIPKAGQTPAVAGSWPACVGRTVNAIARPSPIGSRSATDGAAGPPLPLTARSRPAIVRSRRLPYVPARRSNTPMTSPSEVGLVKLALWSRPARNAVPSAANATRCGWMPGGTSQPDTGLVAAV